ncbi:preprotein translocase subunit YajC [Algoriphagus sanaruensis]|uniref:Sec translocon accessory complex subunit YajC n=1 Tax=Algoriphagus sanaruensis TaxID=1727163 RepID=A0A142EIU5_9BACT|nr:preprotein translocase subunit YajC [Algoriphagus sanaruensis]AMQ55050.1 preprotein translocase subunit YajC [Algoriphagus sanaruensis]
MDSQNFGPLILMGSLFIIMYFFMIRPQQKKQKETKKFIEEIKKGDDVVTIGGLHGKVAAVEGDVVFLEIDKGVKVKLEKSAISLDFSKKTGTTK